MATPLIEFKNVTFKYHAQAEPTLYDVSFQIFPGEKVLIARRRLVKPFLPVMIVQTNSALKCRDR